MAADLNDLVSDLTPLAIVGASTLVGYFLLRSTIALIAVLTTNPDRRDAALQVLRMLLPRGRPHGRHYDDRNRTPPPREP